MAKGFKLRMSKVITSFQSSCRSKNPSTLPLDPLPSVSRPKLINGFSKYDFYCSSIMRHVSTSFVSVGCSFSSKPAATKPFRDEHNRSQHFKWRKEEKWHVIANIYNDTPRRKIYNTSASDSESLDDEITTLPPPPAEGERKRRRKKKKMFTRHRRSTSSVDHIGWFNFSSETESLVSSSRSFSTDSSSEFNPHLETIREAPISKRRHTKSKRKLTTNLSQHRVSCSSSENETPARLSMFKKVMHCRLTGKVKESFAIVKKSEDPYEDFKKSMTEMILEKQIHEKKDLEELLECFLSLNAKCYHRLIVQAFSDIWESLFFAC